MIRGDELPGQKPLEHLNRASLDVANPACSPLPRPSCAHWARPSKSTGENQREREARSVAGKNLCVSVPLWFRLFVRCLAVSLLCGCATRQPLAFPRPFVFHQDSFAFANETVWDYQTDPATGKTIHHKHQPPPTYSLHCFVVARSARQFFQFAEFDARQPVADESTYRRLIRQVVALDPSRNAPEKKITIPGYPDLYAFSQAHGPLLEKQCGGAWQSYVQRGNWRMIFPFTRSHQAKTAEQLLDEVKRNAPPVVHVLCFPQLTINHSLLVFAAEATAHGIQFAAYDPNTPGQPIRLNFDCAQRRFSFPATAYFVGGRVNVYEIYRAWNY